MIPSELMHHHPVGESPIAVAMELGRLSFDELAAATGRDPKMLRRAIRDGGGSWAMVQDAVEACGCRLVIEHVEG